MDSGPGKTIVPADSGQHTRGVAAQSGGVFEFSRVDNEEGLVKTV